MEWSQAFTPKRLMQPLVHCAALTIDGVVRTDVGPSRTPKHIDMQAQVVLLDMAGHWQPTVTNYLGQVTSGPALAACDQLS